MVNEFNIIIKKEKEATVFSFSFFKHEKRPKHSSAHPIPPIDHVEQNVFPDKSVKGVQFHIPIKTQEGCEGIRYRFELHHAGPTVHRS